jgi:hypothetical protein
MVTFRQRRFSSQWQGSPETGALVRLILRNTDKPNAIRSGGSVT